MVSQRIVHVCALVMMSAKLTSGCCQVADSCHAMCFCLVLQFPQEPAAEAEIIEEW